MVSYSEGNEKEFSSISMGKSEKSPCILGGDMVVFRLRCYAFTSYFLTTQKGLNLVNTLTIIFTVIQLLASLVLIAVILLQSGKSAGLSGAISGGADTFMSKGKAKTLDAKLAKMTKWVALGFVLLTLVLNLL